MEQKIDKHGVALDKRGEASGEVGVRKDGQKVWDKWGIVQNAKKGMWEEVLDAERRGLASEDEVRWEVERGGESEDRLRAWRERKREAFVKRKGYRARGAR